MRRTRAVQSMLCVAALAALTGCGVSTNNPPAERGTEIASLEHSGGGQITSRAPGAVLAEGGTLDALTRLAAGPFASRNPSTQVSFATAAPERSFADLCSGKVDLIEPGRTASDAETAACRKHHFELVGPLLIGSDAVVIATKNEADVGGDCLTVQQARDVFRAGSPYANWSQLGFFDVPLSTTGDLSEPVVDELFARRVLGEPASLGVGALRGDFIATHSADETRRQIVGAETLSRAHAVAARRLARLRARTQAQRQRLVEAAVARADRRVLARIAAVNARNRRQKIQVDAAQLARHNAEIDAAAKRAAAARVNALFDARLSARARRLSASLLAQARTPGVVGFVRFTYYEQWEEQLRPLEIWDPGAGTGSNPGAPDCVFPSLDTVSAGHYPFAFQLLVYTTRQALARAAVREYLLYLVTNAQTLDTRAGLAPITDQQRNADLLALGVQPAPASGEPTAGPPASSGTPPPIATGSPPQTTGSAPEVVSGVPGVGAGPAPAP